MYLSKERKHKNLTYEQHLQVAIFTGKLQNQFHNNRFREADKERTFKYFLFSFYKSNKS
jgi:hypothetical protein